MPLNGPFHDATMEPSFDHCQAQEVRLFGSVPFPLVPALFAVVPPFTFASPPLLYLGPCKRPLSVDALHIHGQPP